jgi:K+-transporting ATPase ATPase C chain
MTSHLRSHLCVLVGTLVLCCGVYPLVVWAVAQSVTPGTANGSLVIGNDGQPVGSSLIAQEFKGDGYFHSRPSAAGFNAAASSASNFGANNPKFRERVEEQLKGEFAGKSNIPADMVTTSGSGLDPHISLAGARVQMERIAKARNRSANEIETVLNELASSPPFGGEPIVNVLLLNRELDRRFPPK